MELNVGSSAKIEYNNYVGGGKYETVEYRGLICSKKNHGGDDCVFHLMTDKPVVNDSVPNIKTLYLSKMLKISATRFPKEVSEALKKQLKIYLDEKKLQSQIKILNDKLVEINMQLVNALKEVNEAGLHSNPLDIGLLGQKIKKDVNELLPNYCSDDDAKLTNGVYLDISFKNIVKDKSKIVLSLDVCLVNEERLLSKEFEDRIRNDECVSKSQIERYTPDIKQVAYVLNKFGKFVNERKSVQTQDKGWVSFSVSADLKINLDKSNCNTMIQDLATAVKKELYAN